MPIVVLPLLGGCVMGPNFNGAPRLPASAGPTFVRAESLQAAQSPRLAPWWRDLADPLLNRLIDQALSSNPSMEMAQARVRQARAQVRGAEAASAPVIGSGSGVGDLRAPALLTGGEARSTPVFATGFDAMWEIDVFGGRRRGLEAADAYLGASEAAAEDARLSLTAEVARVYLTQRAVQHQLQLFRQMLDLQERAVMLTRQLEDAGRVSRSEREAAERDLEARRIAVAALQAELNDCRDALAVLTGEAPGALDSLLAEVRPIPLPPSDVTIDDPAGTIARRPDIRAAEHRLRAANAQIGVAQAARMPHVSLAGVVGLGGAARGDLYDMSDVNNLFSLAGPTLTWTFADFGRGRAGVDQTIAGRDEAEAAYRVTVLAALQDAESALNRYGQARQTLASQARSAVSARQSADLADQVYRAGRSSALSAIGANSQRLAAEAALIQAQAELTIRYVSLHKALATGWQA
jgi:NodT family efflux transporter outer membrane factor (OMF) lipoprotein